MSGGDWNHSLRGPWTGFTVRGRDRLVRAADELQLTGHTEAELAQAGHHGRSHAIDHIACRHPKRPVDIRAGAPHRTHEAYVVELPLPRPAGADVSSSMEEGVPPNVTPKH